MAQVNAREANRHAERASTLMSHVDGRIEAGDRLQASEKLWGVVAHTLKEIAERHGWQNDDHRDLHHIASYLSSVSGDEDIRTGMMMANGFHRNFYEDDAPMSSIRAGVKPMGELVDRLQAAEKQYDAGARPADNPKANTPVEYFGGLDDPREAIKARLMEKGLVESHASSVAGTIHAAQEQGIYALSVPTPGGTVTLTRSGTLRLSKPKAGSRTSRPSRASAVPGFRTPRM